MPKTRLQKEAQLKAVTDRLTSAQGLVFTADRGLTVAETEDLRSKLRAENAGLQVIKKTLLKRALQDANLEADLSNLGTIAVAYSDIDAVTPARLVNDVAKISDKYEILGGILEGAFITKDKVIALAKLPSRQQLLAQVVATINAPVSGFVNVLAGNMRNLVTVLKAVQDKK